MAHGIEASNPVIPPAGIPSTQSEANVRPGSSLANRSRCRLEDAITLRIVRLRSCRPLFALARRHPQERDSACKEDVRLPRRRLLNRQAARPVRVPTAPPRPARSRNHTLGRVTPIGCRYLGLPVARRVGEQRGGNRGTQGSVLDCGVSFGGLGAVGEPYPRGTCVWCRVSPSLMVHSWSDGGPA